MSAPAARPRRVLSLIPPMTQLNTPYPSTAYLTGFLRSRGIDAVQDDLALKLVLELFTPAGLDALRERVRALPGKKRPPTLANFDAQFGRYRATVGPVIAFLQGRDPTVAQATSGCDWRIADLVDAQRPVSLYLVIPPSDISRTKPLVRLILNQIGRCLTERLEGDPSKAKRVLGWKHKYDLKALVNEMVQSDLELFKRDVYLKKGGHKILHEQE